MSSIDQLPAIRQLSEWGFVPVYHSIPEYLAAIETQPYRHTAIHSAIQLFKSALTPIEQQTRRSIVSLGCGRGFELVAERIVFGETAAITGVDKLPVLRHNDDLSQNICLARASFLSKSMEGIDGIVCVSGVPDLIVVRHPIPVVYPRRPKEVRREIDVYGQSIKPWVELAHKRSIPMLFSFYRTEKPLAGAFRTRLLEPIVGEACIKEGNRGKMVYRYYNRDGDEIVPDYYWLRVN